MPNTSKFDVNHITRLVDNFAIGLTIKQTPQKKKTNCFCGLTCRSIDRDAQQDLISISGLIIFQYSNNVSGSSGNSHTYVIYTCVAEGPLCS